MKQTCAFTRLDFMTIKPFLTLKNVIIFSLVFAFIGYGTQNPYMVVSMLMMYGTIYISYPFAVGDKNGIDTLYAVLPLQRGQVVAGRYCFALTVNLLTAGAALGVSALLMTLMKQALDIRVTLLVILISFFIFTLIEAVQLPIYFKMGYAKAKFLSMLPLLGFPAAVVGAASLLQQEKMAPLLEKTGEWIAQHVLVSTAAAIIVWCIMMAASCALAMRFYQRRDF